MYTLFIGLTIFASVLLVLVVLAQNSKGGGLSSQFGGSSASNLIGVKKTGDLLEKLTWGLAISVMVLVLATNLTTPNSAGSGDELLARAKDWRKAHGRRPVIVHDYNWGGYITWHGWPELLNWIEKDFAVTVNRDFGEILITAGAGDIDMLLETIKELLKNV